jgi:hypothetical protein
VDSCNVVNWIVGILFHPTWHRQLKALTVAFVEKKCDVEVNTVCLFVCLFVIFI